jgi:hypothetical protein
MKGKCTTIASEEGKWRTYLYRFDPFNSVIYTYVQFATFSGNAKNVSNCNVHVVGDGGGRFETKTEIGSSKNARCNLIPRPRSTHGLP